MTIQINITLAAETSTVPDNASCVDFDVLNDGEFVCGVTIVAGHDGSPVMYGECIDQWCSDDNALALAFREDAISEFPADDDTMERDIYKKSIELAYAELTSDITRCLRHWCGEEWSGLNPR